MLGEPGCGAQDEAGAGGAWFIGQDLGVGGAGVVVDSDVDIVVANRVAQSALEVRAFAAAMDPPATAVGNPADLLDVDVD